MVVTEENLAIQYILTHLKKKLKKLTKLQETKISQQILIEYKHTIKIMWRYFCIRFIDLMLKGKSLLDYTNLFSPNYYEKDHKIIPKYFK